MVTFPVSARLLLHFLRVKKKIPSFQTPLIYLELFAQTKIPQRRFKTHQ